MSHGIRSLICKSQVLETDLVYLVHDSSTVDKLSRYVWDKVFIKFVWNKCIFGPISKYVSNTVKQT